jgi:hypothetical protein
VDAYAPYNHSTRSGYYCNQWYPNDKVITNSFKFTKDPVSIDFMGNWKVIAGYEYVSMNNQNTTKTQLNGTVTGFIRDRVILNDSVAEYVYFNLIIGSTVFSIGNGFSFTDTNYPNNSTIGVVIDQYQYNSKFKSIKLYSDSESIVVIIVDVSENINQMLIQTQEFVDNQETSTAPISYRRYLLEKQ